MFSNGPLNIKTVDNSLMWAVFTFFNAHFFYLAPVYIYFSTNRFDNISVKLALMFIFFIFALRNILILKHHLMIVLMISSSAIFLLFPSGNIYNYLTVAMPVIIAIALMRIHIPSFLYKYFVITNIFWFFYLLCFVFFYKEFTEFDAYSVERVAVDKISMVTRAALGFVSPNNIGSALCVAAVISYLVDRKGVAMFYLLLGFATYFYTDSRSVLASTILIFLFISMNLIWQNTKRINLIIFYLIILTLIFLGLFTYLGVLDQYKTLDRIFSHRLHYLHLILIPSFFGSLVPHTLDTSMMDLLNKGGIFAFSVVVYVMNKVIKIDNHLSLLVIGFLLLGLSENILNQYNILAPLIFLFYFKEKNKNHFVKDLN